MEKEYKPSTYAFRLNEYIDKNLESFVNDSGLNQTMVARSVFSAGLKAFDSGDQFRNKSTYDVARNIHKVTGKASFQLLHSQIKAVDDNQFMVNLKKSELVRFIFMLGVLFIKSEHLKNSDAIMTGSDGVDSTVIRSSLRGVILFNEAV